MVGAGAGSLLVAGRSGVRVGWNGVGVSVVVLWVVVVGWRVVSAIVRYAGFAMA
jgi:hypothetical protein